MHALERCSLKLYVPSLHRALAPTGTWSVAECAGACVRWARVGGRRGSAYHATRAQTTVITTRYGIATPTMRRNLCSRNTHRGGGHLGGSAYLPLSTTDEHRECVR